MVAAASKAAKFWLERGGFKTTIKSTIKSGQVHIMYKGLHGEMDAFYAFAKADLLQSIQSINASMKKTRWWIIRRTIDKQDRCAIGLLSTACYF